MIGEKADRQRAKLRSVQMQLLYTDVESEPQQLLYTVTTPPYFVYNRGERDAGRLVSTHNVSMVGKDSNMPVAVRFTQADINHMKVSHGIPNTTSLLLPTSRVDDHYLRCSEMEQCADDSGSAGLFLNPHVQPLVAFSLRTLLCMRNNGLTVLFVLIQTLFRIVYTKL